MKDIIRILVNVALLIYLWRFMLIGSYKTIEMDCRAGDFKDLGRGIAFISFISIVMCALGYKTFNIALSFLIK